MTGPLKFNEFTLSEAKELAKKCIEKRIPVVLWGTYGIGKTSLVREIGLETNRIVRTINLQQHDPVELFGCLVPNKETKKTEQYPLGLLPDANEKARGLIFYDEFSLSPKSTQNIILSLLLERRIGEYSIPDGWEQVMAANRPEDLPGIVKDLLPTTRTRIAHIPIKLSFEEWLIWATRKKIRKEIIGFLSFRKDLLHTSKLAEADFAFPTPRTWEMASRLIEGYEIEHPDVKRLITITVGAQTAVEFDSWIKIYRKINVKDILDGRVIMDTKDINLYASLLAIACYVNNQKFNDELVEKVIKNVLEPLKKSGRSYIIVFFSFLDEQKREKLLQNKGIDSVVDSVVSIL